MKKIIFCLIASLMFSGSIFAQHQSHWSDFNNSPYEQHGDIVATVSIDGNMIGPSYENYNEAGDYYVNYDYEVAAFVNDTCRGHGFLAYYEGDDYATTNMMGIYYYPDASDTGLEVTFKLYDHVNQVEYVFCTSSQTILTGEDYNSWDNIVHLSFSSSFTKEIDAWTPEGGFYLIASPLNAAVSPIDVLNMTTSGDYDLYAFDQAAEDGLEWRNYKANAFENLEAGTGYLYANESGEDLTFIGAPYNGNGEVTLTKVDNVEFSGWNLVGNPFPQKAYITKPYYTMGEGGVEVVPGEGNEIGPMQGIFVIAENDGDKVTFSTDNPGKAKGLVINVNKNRGSIVDRAIIRFEEEALLPKFMLNESHTKLYIPQNDKEYAVVSADNKTNEMPLNFTPAEEGTYTLKFNTEDVETGYLHLIDNLTGIDVDLLATPSYTFDARLTDYASRFRLVFQETFTNSSENENNGSFAIINNGNLIINNVDGTATFEMIDITGRIISTETINGSYNKAIRVKAGVYTLRLIQGESIRTQKVVVE